MKELRRGWNQKTKKKEKNAADGRNGHVSGRNSPPPLVIVRSAALLFGRLQAPLQNTSSAVFTEAIFSPAPGVARRAEAVHITALEI